MRSAREGLELEQLVQDAPFMDAGRRAMQFGSAAHHDLPLLAECLVRERSELRPFLVLSRRFDQLVVEDPAGQRRCTIVGRHVRFTGERLPSAASWPTRELAARAIRRYCEAGERVADILADPAAVVAMRDGVVIDPGDE